MSEPIINRQCQRCFGLELDDGVSELCYCEEEDDIYECRNLCGETVHLGGFCSTACKLEWEVEHDEFDE